MKLERSKLESSFHLHSLLSNFAWLFPTSLGSFQLKQKLSNFRLSNLKLSNSSFFPTALFNYMYPEIKILVHLISNLSWSVCFLLSNLSMLRIFLESGISGPKPKFGPMPVENFEKFQTNPGRLTRTDQSPDLAIRRSLPIIHDAANIIPNKT